jgi:hypothetical protein
MCVSLDGCNRYSRQNLMKLEFLDRVYKNRQITNFIKGRPVGAEMFQADKGTERLDGDNSRFSQFC